MNKPFLEKIRKEDLEDFMDILTEVEIEFDRDKFREIALNTLRYLNGKKELRDKLRYMQELENKWYASLENGRADYSVYDDVYYLADCWVCWKKYSRQYIKDILNPKNMEDGKSIREHIGEVKRVADLGNGIGYSTPALQEAFNCQVFATNLRDTSQWKVCDKLAWKNGYFLYQELWELPIVDVVFASEYFEHFERPVEHLRDVLTTLKPNHILFANTFNAKSIGHFNVYKDQGEDFTGLQISRLFTKTLKQYGYQKVKTKCFNNRPNYYKYVG